MITTVITTVLKTTVEQFESKDVQELLNQISSGEAQRDMKKSGKSKDFIDIKMSYQTDYKQVVKKRDSVALKMGDKIL